jgi:hypothetical protein
VSEIINTLVDSLRVVDRDSEREALHTITALHQQTRIVHGQLHISSFQDTANVWFNLVKKKETGIISELKRAVTSIAFIDETDLTTISECIDDIFDDSKYVNRLIRFKDGVVRSVQRYGLTTVDPRLLDTTTIDAAYRAGITNSLSEIRTKISNDIKILISHRSVAMGFESLLTDKVKVLKRSGEAHENISASVQSNKIFIEGVNILIETGDLISRSMSNGGQETFEVIDPGFHEDFHGIPAGYQIQVKKLGVPEARAAIQNITVNISGTNARFNNNSIDNSINTVAHQPALDQLTALRLAINKSLAPEQKGAAIEIVDAVESQFKSGSPSKTIVSTLLAALPHVANITTIVSTILGLL